MIEPLKNRILVQRDVADKVTESGFIIPEAAQKKEFTGVVLAVGKDTDELITVGSRVLFGLGDGTEIKAEFCDDKENCLLLMDNQIRGVFQ